MTLTRLDKFPAPYFGGKADAAPLVWAALGDVAHYCEPLCGSLVTLLRRPHLANRTYYSESVNDADGLLVNALRALAYEPDATADAASWYVSEADLHARHLALVRWKASGELERLMGDPRWCDPVMGGHWLWGVSCWIGGGFANGDGPWVLGDDGRLTKRTGGGGVSRKRPFLTDNGQGVNHAGTREPGVARKLPHLGDNGQGVNRPQLREPGVARKLPHLGNNGQGVNHAGTREPGVARQLPFLANNGQGVNHAGTREPGVARQLPHLTTDGQGVNRPQLREPGAADGSEPHPMTMPELRRWFAWLSARLRHVRILNGDWSRLVTSGALQTLPVRQGKGVAGIFLDPPYSAEAGRADVYAHESATVAHDCRAWCLANGDNPRYRIVLAGYAGEGHEELEAHGWRAVEWFAAGWLKGGMGNQNANGNQQHRERLWLSPHTLGGPAAPLPMDAMWGDDE